MAFRPAHLVHTDEAALVESMTSEAGNGSVEPERAISSAAERHVHTVEVSGSTPLSPTILASDRRPSRFIYFVFSMESERVKIGKAAIWRAENG